MNGLREGIRQSCCQIFSGYPRHPFDLRLGTKRQIYFMFVQYLLHFLASSFLCCLHFSPAITFRSWTQATSHMLKREVYHNDNGYYGRYRLNTEVAGCHICSEDASVSSSFKDYTGQRQGARKGTGPIGYLASPAVATDRPSPARCRARTFRAFLCLVHWSQKDRSAREARPSIGVTYCRA
jgi:hypothetical protein